MPGHIKIKASGSALLVAGLMATTVLVPPAMAGISDAPNTAPPVGGSVDQNVALSTAASDVLVHIAQARGDISEAKPDAAQDELRKAADLLDAIQASLPTAATKNYIWVARKHLQYENAKQVLTDFVPIYRSLDALTEYLPVEDARAHLDKAQESLTQGDKATAAEQLDKAASALVYTEADLPLLTTRNLLQEARAELKSADIHAAETALKSAEDNVVLLSVAVESPMNEAHRSLWRASRDYAAGAYRAAKSDLRQAIRYLDQAAGTADKETRDAAGALSQRAQSLLQRIETNSGSVGTSLDALWRRAEAFSERSAEYVSGGLQHLGAQTGAKADLIEAKLHLSYAEIDRFTADNAAQAGKEIARTEDYLDRALEEAQPDQKPQISAVQDKVASLAATQTPAPKEDRYAEVITQLGKLIETL